MGADRRVTAAVKVRTVDGAWTTLGTDDMRGIVPEGLTLTANESGPDTASFGLRRDPSHQWPDLVAFNQVEIDVAGRPVWGGRIWEAPLSSGEAELIGVQCRGWPYHLDDDLLNKFYVHTDLTAWRPQRSFPTADLTSFTAGGEPTSGDGMSIIGWRNTSIVGNAMGSGITLDLGPGRTAKRIVVTWGALNGNGAFQLYARAHSAENPLTGSTSDAISVGHETLATLPSTTTSAGTFSTGYRYVSLFIYRDDAAAPGAVTADHIVGISAVQVFAATAYESGNASILKADQVIKDVLASGALPLLDSSTANIAAGTFSIPDLAPDGYQTPRALIAAANAYEGNLVGVDLHRKLFSRERSTTPDLEVGSWPGSSFRDSSTNSAEALYNRVIVQGTGPDGSPIAEERTATSSLLDRQGFDRAATLQVGAMLTTASAQALGDIWLAEMSSPKFKGSLTLDAPGGARWMNGGDVHPSELLLRVGSMVRVGVVDPATGAWTRDATIKSVSYSHDTETATVELDNERGNFGTFLERLGVLTAAALR